MSSALKIQASRIATGAAVGLLSCAAVFTTLFVSEILVGTNVLLRILLSTGWTLATSALCFGILKFVLLFPLRITSTLAGAAIIVTWVIYNILAAFPILPFGANFPLTFGVSLLMSATVLLFAMLIGGTIASQNKHISGALILASVFLLVGWTWWFIPSVTRSATNSEDSLTAFVQGGIPYPAAAGKFKINRLSYGGGIDRHRPEFGEHATLRTKPVDASPFIPAGWSHARSYYWGFDYTHLPINGLVWFPEGNGPFPLVLIVHGTHVMTEPSDSGFAYLGELLASHGYIAVSIDENFFNCGWYRYGDFEASDIDARGWLILQHLAAWKKWNESRGNPFFGKVDLNSIALIGHSRGGEAIAAATSFNRMERYPRDAGVRFNFKFNIRTLIALSPSDIKQPMYGRTTPASIKDVNYLLLQGMHDRDVPTIVGSRVYQKVVFGDYTDGSEATSHNGRHGFDTYMKAALYIYRANHSQFNSTWGAYDFPWPYRIFENVATQLHGDEQRRIAQIYVLSFLEATLRDERRYIPIFRDYHSAGSWLPKTAYISRFQDSLFHTISNFDEDIDPGTTTVTGGQITGKDFSHWDEQDIDPHYYLPYGSRCNRVVYLRWEAEKGRSPSFRLEPPQDRLKSWRLQPDDMLMFSIAFSDERRSSDIVVELTDTAGQHVRLPLKEVFVLQMPLLSYLTTLKIIEKPSPQTVLQTISIPLSRFLSLNPSFNLKNLRTIGFLFDATSSGAVFIDDIGIDKISQAKGGKRY